MHTPHNTKGRRLAVPMLLALALLAGCRDSLSRLTGPEDHSPAGAASLSSTSGAVP